MKAWLIFIVFLFKALSPVQAQRFEIEQLLLNFEKLNQMRQILDDMKKGYEIISQGYGLIKNIAEGNFSLHDIFLNNLLQISPTVRNYYKIAETISFQGRIVKEYKAGLQLFAASRWMSTGGLDYIRRYYAGLNRKSLQSLADLASVITAGKMRMTDDERLARIDRIHKDVKIRLISLRQFNAKTSALLYERFKEINEIEVMETLQGME